MFQTNFFYDRKRIIKNLSFFISICSHLLRLWRLNTILEVNRKNSYKRFLITWLGYFANVNVHTNVLCRNINVDKRDNLPFDKFVYDRLELSTVQNTQTKHSLCMLCNKMIVIITTMRNCITLVDKCFSYLFFYRVQTFSYQTKCWK